MPLEIPHITIEFRDKYPFAWLTWKGYEPTINIEDGYEDKADELISFASKLYAKYGGEVKFHPEKAVRT